MVATPDPRFVKLGLLLFLKKLNVLDLEKRAISHMMNAMSSPNFKLIPEGAIVLDTISLNVEYIMPCKRGQGNWPAR